MKTIISAKYLSAMLIELLEEDKSTFFEMVLSNGEGLILNNVVINCEVENSEMTENYRRSMLISIKDYVSNLEDQPLIVEFYEEYIEIFAVIKFE